MQFSKSFQIEENQYEPTKDTLIANGLKVSELTIGSRKMLYANNEVCGYSKLEYYLPLSESLTDKQFYSFLGAFKKSLFKQFLNNPGLIELNIEFDGVSRDKNLDAWLKLKNRSLFYNVDLSSAYWQMAYKLGYISKPMFEKYMPKDAYKEAKRYCVSFLAREIEMQYFDNREINVITCNTDVFKQVYQNIRHELYHTIDALKSLTEEHWINYNIDGISVKEKQLQSVTSLLDKLGLQYKVNECIKIDKKEYFFKGSIRKF